MKFRLSSTRGWEVCYVQGGSPTGWSAWEPMDRQHALERIERGFDFERVY
jgi:hypothetical protein